MSKSIFASRTFWVNVVSTSLEVAQALSGTQVVPPGALAVTTNLLNITLRLLTSQAVHVVAPTD